MPPAAASPARGVQLSHPTIMKLVLFRVAARGYGRAMAIAVAPAPIAALPWLPFRCVGAPLLMHRPAPLAGPGRSRAP